MRLGDRVLYYHSVTAKAVVGVATVSRRAYPDPTAKSGDWVCVDLKPVKPLARPVTLEQIKKTRNSRKPPFSSIPGSR
jgi:predicted RNA-binding protein with PUA-like domain